MPSLSEMPVSTRAWLPTVNEPQLLDQLSRTEDLVKAFESRMEQCRGVGLDEQLMGLLSSAKSFAAKAASFAECRGTGNYQRMISDLYQSAQVLNDAMTKLYSADKDKIVDISSMMIPLKDEASAILKEMRLTAIY
jgi:hypothetical protein